MTITAEVIADSVSPDGIRLTTMQLRYPRFIHAEFMTHRVLSRNASSSRAIPVKRLIQSIRQDPAMPIHFGAAQAGMQAHQEVEPWKQAVIKFFWLAGMWIMTSIALLLAWFGAHKQLVNRLVEPWAHIIVVVTATDWDNFFALRRHPDAQPEIKALADAMWVAMEASQPHNLNIGDWHLPYIEDCEIAMAYNGTGDLAWGWAMHNLKKVSVARCARVSYLTHDGRQTTIEEDLALYDRLVGAQPIHASPAEHQATPDTYDMRDEMLATAAGKGKLAWQPRWSNPELHGNFRGWIQYRKTLPGEAGPDLGTNTP